jgi:hypothetical protein
MDTKEKKDDIFKLTLDRASFQARIFNTDIVGYFMKIKVSIYIEDMVILNLFT